MKDVLAFAVPVAFRGMFIWLVLMSRPGYSLPNCASVALAPESAAEIGLILSTSAGRAYIP